MKRNEFDPYDCHENVSLILPWYVNKSLHDDEIETVEQHLKICFICKRDLQNLQRLAIAVKQSDSLDSAAKASFDRLKGRLHTAKVAQPQTISPAPVPISPTHAQKRPPQFNFAKSGLAIAASMLIAVLLPSYDHFFPSVKNDYRTLSNAELTDSNQQTLRVIFKENTPQQTIGQILASIQGHIVSGPDEHALYTIAFESSIQANEVLNKLPLLRNNTDVVFAEPAYGLVATSPTSKQ